MNRVLALLLPILILGCGGAVPRESPGTDERVRVGPLAPVPRTRFLHETGANGYTLFTVEGEGSQRQRTADIQEFANIQAGVIVQPTVATQLLTRLEQEFLPKCAMVAYETDIRVLRRENC